MIVCVKSLSVAADVLQGSLDHVPLRVASTQLLQALKMSLLKGRAPRHLGRRSSRRASRPRPRRRVIGFDVDRIPPGQGGAPPTSAFAARAAPPSSAARTTRRPISLGGSRVIV